MNCREFQERHCAFVDDTLPGVELVRMQQHLIECRCCASLDTRVRKSLMLLQSLPHIEPSCDFQEKLRNRLKCQKPLPPLPTSYLNETTYGLLRGNKGVMGMAGAVLTGAAILAYISFSATGTEKPQDLILPPVVASIPEAQEGQAQVADATIQAQDQEQADDESSIDTPSMEVFATAGAGVPAAAIWPTAIMAEDIPVQRIGSPRAISPRPVPINNGVTPVGLSYRP